MRKINYRKIWTMVADALIVALTGFLSNAILSLADIIFYGDAYHLAVTPIRIFWVVGMNMLFCFICLFIVGVYNHPWRTMKPHDFLFCAIGAGFGVSFGAVFSMMSGHEETVVYFILNLILTIAGLVLFRVIFRRTFIELVDVGRAENEKYTRTLIVGAGAAARMIITEIENAQKDSSNPSHDLLPVAIVDDDINKLGTKIHGIDVVGMTKDIPAICKEYRIELVLFCIPSCEEEDRKRIMESCSKSGCKIKMIPYLSQLFVDENSTSLLTQVKDIKIEDLLGRDPITFDKTKIRNFIEGKVCMVTGGGGSIGSELVRQIAKYNPKQIIIVDIYENNAYDIQQELFLEYEDKLDLVTLIASVRDYDKMEQIFRDYRPELVFHAAAHKHVPLMEVSPAEAVKNNIFGTWNVIDLSEKYGVRKFVMISTDKAVNPTNVMGATKRCCEMLVQYKSQQGSRTEFVTTRFGNVLGSNGSVIPLFRRQIEAGKPVTVTHPDIIRYFMTIPEAVSLVLEAGAIAKGGEIFVLDMGDPVKITTLAENLIRMYGKVPYRDVEIRFTGLRPGEKLFEELLMDEEGLKSTENKKIYIGNQINIDPDGLMTRLDELRVIADSNDPDKTVDKLSEIVDTFHHNSN